jgi:hypothetical protein
VLVAKETRRRLRGAAFASTVQIAPSVLVPLRIGLQLLHVGRQLVTGGFVITCAAVRAAINWSGPACLSHTARATADPSRAPAASASRRTSCGCEIGGPRRCPAFAADSSAWRRSPPH